MNQSCDTFVDAGGHQVVWRSKRPAGCLEALALFGSGRDVAAAELSFEVGDDVLGKGTGEGVVAVPSVQFRLREVGCR